MRALVGASAGLVVAGAAVGALALVGPGTPAPHSGARPAYADTGATSTTLGPATRAAGSSVTTTTAPAPVAVTPSPAPVATPSTTTTAAPTTTTTIVQPATGGPGGCGATGTCGGTSTTTSSTTTTTQAP